MRRSSSGHRRNVEGPSSCARRRYSPRPALTASKYVPAKPPAPAERRHEPVLVLPPGDVALRLGISRTEAERMGLRPNSARIQPGLQSALTT